MFFQSVCYRGLGDDEPLFHVGGVIPPKSTSTKLVLVSPNSLLHLQLMLFLVTFQAGKGHDPPAVVISCGTGIATVSPHFRKFLVGESMRQSLARSLCAVFGSNTVDGQNPAPHKKPGFCRFPCKYQQRMVIHSFKLGRNGLRNHPQYHLGKMISLQKSQIPIAVQKAVVGSGLADSFRASITLELGYSFLTNPLRT